MQQMDSCSHLSQSSFEVGVTRSVSEVSADIILHTHVCPTDGPELRTEDLLQSYWAVKVGTLTAAIIFLARFQSVKWQLSLPKDQVKHIRCFKNGWIEQLVQKDSFHTDASLDTLASLSSLFFSKYWRATAWIPGCSHGDMPINARHVQTVKPELTV